MHRFGPFVLDPARRVLTHEGCPVSVTARPFDILLALVERAGQIVGKDELLRLVWRDTVVEEANLSQHIFLLRKLLGHTEEQPYITTVPRRGYQFVAEVSSLPGAPSAPRAVVAPSPLPGPVRLDIALSPGTALAMGTTRVVALARDGSKVVCVVEEGATTHLFLRNLDQFDGRRLPGTEGATGPFFSPDGRWIGFESRRRLQKLPLDGGPALALCEVADMRGAAWTASGDIVFAPGPTTGLWRIAASGGVAAPLTTLAFEAGERTHRWPHAAPDSDAIFFTIGYEGATSFDEASLAITDSRTGHRLVVQHATDGRCLADGRLVWSRGAALFAAAFEMPGGHVVGTPRLVQQCVSTSATGVAHFDWSSNGVLLHVPGEAETMRRVLVSVGTDGEVTQRHISGESLEEPRLAPGGAAAIVSLRNRRSDLWLYDFARGSLTRLTFDGENFAGIWGPDPNIITFSSSRGGPSDLYLLRPDRSSAPELLVGSEFDKVAGAWSADGGSLLYTEYHPDTGADLWLLDRQAGQARPFIRTKFNEYAAVIAPSGRHAAYVTDESGRAEVVVVTFPDAAGKIQLSTEGGTEPVWSPSGSELFYRSGNRMMRVDLRAGVERAGIPTTLFEGSFVGATITLANYDLSADGTVFLMVRAEQPARPSVLGVTIGCDGSS